MKIDYILSDTTKMATTTALKEVVSKAESDILGTYVVLVPETKSIIIEKELLNLSKTGAFANVYVYSFVRLMSRLGFISADKIVSKQTCVMLLRKIIFDNLSNLKCYQKTAKTVGFAEKIYDTIQQFKSSNITAEDLKQRSGDCTKALKSKLDDITFLYEEYEKALGEGLYDDCDKLNLISQFSKTSDFVKNAEFVVVGFDNITFEMVSVLKELAKNSKSITFSCCYFNDKRSDKHIQDNQLYNKFKHIADELKIPYIPKFVPTNKVGDFYAIQNYLFSTEKKVFESKGNVLVFEAKSKRQEIDYVANQILIEIENGKRFRDIGLYVCSLLDNLKLIEDCFKAYEIPYFVNREHDISNHALTRFILSCFELKKSHLSSEKVLNFLSSVFVDDGNFGVFENYANAVGINYNAFLDDLNESSFQNHADFVKVNGVLTAFQKFYNLLNIKLSKSKTISDYLSVVDFVLDYYSVQNKLENVAKFEKDNGYVLESEISLAIFDKCKEFNLSLANFMGRVQVSLEEFLQIYTTGFTSIKLNLSPVSIDCVIVQENTDGFYGIKDMFVFGAEDGKFPAKLQDSGIILDSELQETKMLISKDIEPSVKEINDRELFRVYEAFLEPTERLFVSYSVSSIGGAQNKPSRMILRLFNLFGEGIKQTTYKRTSYAVKTGYEMKFAKHIGKYFNGEYLKDKLNTEYNVLKESLTPSLKNYLTNLEFSDKSFEIAGVQDLYFPNKTTSISQLQNYFLCPYSFFASYGLRLKENKNAKLSSIDIGSIVHRIVELFMKEISSFNGLDEGDFEKGVQKICDETYIEYETNTKQNKAILNFISNEAKRLCKHLFYEQQVSSFKNEPTLNEYSFGGENAVKLQIDDNTVIAIEGKIDRIDEWGNYIRIIDYKTGDVKSDLGSIYYGRKIQLVSYLSAVSGIKNKKVAGLFYLPIHSDFVKNNKKIKDIYKLQGFLLDDADVLKHMDNTVNFENNESHLIPLKIKTNKDVLKTNTFEISKGNSKIYYSSEQFEDIKSYTEELCKTAVQEILSGYAEPSPAVYSGEDEGACKYCKLAGFCDIENAKFKNGRKCNNLVSITSFGENNKGDNNEQS